MQIAQQKQYQRRTIEEFLTKNKQMKEAEIQAEKETEIIRSIHADARYKIECLKNKKEKEVNAKL